MTILPASVPSAITRTVAGLETQDGQRRLALVSGAAGVAALATTSATAWWFGLGAGTALFAVAAIASFRARAWSLFAIAFAVLLYSGLALLFVWAASDVTWAPF
jgi:hypothetical protein